MSLTVVAHCDWSIADAKRVMAVALRTIDGWAISPPEPVGDTATLFERLAARGEPGGLLVGFDVPIGIPAASAEKAGLFGFRDLLRRMACGDYPDLARVAATVEEISLTRPFYPARPGGTRRAHLFAALGLDATALTRRCEQATASRGAASMLFWTLGGNQVGKAALSGWRELILPRLDHVRLWPFDGPLAALTGEGVTLVETYPGDVYARLGIPFRPLGKTSQAGRQRAAPYLARWIAERPVTVSPALAERIADGFGPAKSGEDPFDALVGLFGMLDVVDGRRPEGVPDDPAVRETEGWILGQL